MYSDKLLLLKLDDIQEGLYRLDYNLNASDSLAILKLSDNQKFGTAALYCREAAEYAE